MRLVINLETFIDRICTVHQIIDWNGSTLIQRVLRERTVEYIDFLYFEIDRKTSNTWFSPREFIEFHYHHPLSLYRCLLLLHLLMKQSKYRLSVHASERFSTKNVSIWGKCGVRCKDFHEVTWICLPIAINWGHYVHSNSMWSLYMYALLKGFKACLFRG